MKDKIIESFTRCGVKVSGSNVLTNGHGVFVDHELEIVTIKCLNACGHLELLFTFESFGSAAIKDGSRLSIKDSDGVDRTVRFYTLTPIEFICDCPKCEK